MFSEHAEKIELIKKHVRSYPDFPKKGILFRDIFSALLEPKVFALIREISSSYAAKLTPKVECVVALESRGFLIGPTLALDLQVPFVPIRKKGKLPGSVLSHEYDLEYGKDTVEIQRDSIRKGMRVLVVDDLLATGGTLSAGCKLLKQCNAEIVSCFVIMELVDLNGMSFVPATVHSLMQFKN